MVEAPASLGAAATAATLNWDPCREDPVGEPHIRQSSWTVHLSCSVHATIITDVRSANLGAQIGRMRAECGLPVRERGPIACTGETDTDTCSLISLSYHCGLTDRALLLTKQGKASNKRRCAYVASTATGRSLCTKNRSRRKDLHVCLPLTGEDGACRPMSGAAFGTGTCLPRPKHRKDAPAPMATPWLPPSMRTSKIPRDTDISLP